METTKHTQLSTQIQNIGIQVKRRMKGNRSLSIPERDFIEKFADELSLRLPIGTTLYYQPNDPMNPVNEYTREDILEWIDKEVHVPKSSVKNHKSKIQTALTWIKKHKYETYMFLLAAGTFIAMILAIIQILNPNT